MSESEIPVERGEESGASAPARARRAPRPKGKSSATRSAPAARRKPASASTRKRKPAAATPAVVRGRRDLETLIQNLAKKASGARNRLASASGEGAQATRRTLRKMSDASRKAIGRLGSEWKKMEPATKVQVLAALFTTLAAASAPLVRKGLRKR